MLQVKNIVKYYGKNKAVDNLSFEVKDGEIFGLLGENGAGKTTTFRIIMGLLEATEGKVLLDGKYIDYSITDKIGFVTEERSLLTKMTVKEQLIFYGVLKGMSEKQIEKEIKKWLKEFQIENYENRKIKELSKGNQQKIQFISAVLHHPKLLILDEPFTGLDPINVELMKKAIYKLQKEGCSIIFSSHHIKKEYKKKNIIIRGKNLPLKEIEKIKGVISVTKQKEEYMVKIEQESVAKEVFAKIKDKDITKYDVAEPTLNEIFIAKVGGLHE